MGIVAKPARPTLRQDHPLSAGLLGAWLYTNGSGDSVRDLSCLNNHETWNTYDWGSPPNGGGWSMGVTADNRQGTAACGTSLSFGGGGVDRPFSLVAGASIIDATKYSTVHAKLPEYVLGGDSSGRIHINLYHPGYAIYIGRVTPIGTLTSNAGAYRNIISTYDGSRASSGLKIYVDAVRSDNADENAGSYSNMTPGTGSLTVGGTSNRFWCHYRFIYGRVLSQSEISWINHDPYAAFRPKRHLVCLGVLSAVSSSPAPSSMNIGPGVGIGI